MKKISIILIILLIASTVSCEKEPKVDVVASACVTIEK